MKIDKVHIKGFRSFDDEVVTLQKKTLIIGANDVGKTNLIYALRLLFDKSLNEHDLELTDSDYNAYSHTDTIEITVYLSEIVEDCLLSAFQGAVKNGELIIQYTNSKNGSYRILTGFSEETLSETTTRQYIKRLNMQCVDTNRDLFSFLRRERIHMLQLAKERLTPEATIADEEQILQIQTGLDNINKKVSSLNYVSSALEQVNAELSALSIHNEDQSVQFVAGESDAAKLLDNLVLAYSSADKPLTLGGDGRNNQIFLATWIAKQNIQKSVDHVTFFAIEEPESHLHPHQQRKLSEYIQNNFSDQIIITSHSPHIAAKFNTGNIVRLYTKNKYSYAACGGCSEFLKKTLSEFGYRMNSLSAETFFADGIFLVEGTSEVLFYTALSREIGIDLDYLNITILSVEGVGFKPYVAVCDALNIPWVLRTDNDVFSKPTNAPTEHYYAGISRIMGILEETSLDGSKELLDYWTEHKAENDWPYNTSVSKAASNLNAYIRKQGTAFGLYVSNNDLENDLANSSLSDALKKHYNKKSVNTLVKAMQTKKATNMLDFLSEQQKTLSTLRTNEISEPIVALADKVKGRSHPENA